MKTTLSNKELVALGYKPNIFNDYYFRVINSHDAIIVDNESRDVEFPSSASQELKDELKLK